MCCAAKEIVYGTLATIYQNEPIPLHGVHGHDSSQKIGDAIHIDLNKGGGFFFLSNTEDER